MNWTMSRLMLQCPATSTTPQMKNPTLPTPLSHSTSHTASLFSLFVTLSAILIKSDYRGFSHLALSCCLLLLSTSYFNTSFLSLLSPHGLQVFSKPGSIFTAVFFDQGGNLADLFTHTNRPVHTLNLMGPPPVL